MSHGVGISDLFSRIGGNARFKVVVLDSINDRDGAIANQLRSLNIEHVSPAKLMAQEISRRTSVGQNADRLVQSGRSLPEELILTVMRRWFWTRKPDAGFALSEFPATLLQAKVFDEWLDSRGEALDGVSVGESTACEHVITHYRNLGLLITAEDLAA